MGEEMYHAITAKDYKPLQNPLGFRVHLLLHTEGVPVWAGGGWGALEQVPAGYNWLRGSLCSV